MGALAFLVLVTISWAAANNPKISPGLQERLNKGEKVGILVSFDGVDDICIMQIPESRSASAPDRGKQVKQIKDKLVIKMESSQAGVALKLSTRSGGSASNFSQFWITNQMLVDQANPDLIKSIAEDPKVSKIVEQPRMHLIKMEEDGVDLKTTIGVGEPKFNLIQTKVPEAWAELGDNRGEGIVIGFIDSGVRYTHEIFEGRFVGEYGWFDPRYKTTEPIDENGHGTHVHGLAVGGKAIGVAPGAKFATCRICSPGEDGTTECRVEESLSCAQFFTCPTLTDGTNHDCSKAPHIINNSWGFEEDFDDFFAPMLQCWHAAGIIPVFSLGNSGANGSCESALYPGYREDVISVGNIAMDDGYSKSSSRGPTPDGRIVPDLVAPGEKVVSAGKKSDTEYYNRYVGTSQAAPHVSGAIALLLSKNKKLSFDQIKVKLLASADPVVIEDAPQCGNVSADVFPNNVVGYGRLNVLKLLQLA